MEKDTIKKVIDWASIMDVCGYESMVKEVIETNLEDGEQTLETLAELVKQNDASEVTLYAHRLKGLAMTMGAIGLSEKAYHVERAGSENDMSTAALVFGDVRDEFEKVKSFLSQDNWVEIAKRQAE